VRLRLQRLLNDAVAPGLENAEFVAGYGTNLDESECQNEEGDGAHEEQ
jgi:hypothetical protein